MGNGHDRASSEDGAEGSHVSEDACESLEDRVIDHGLGSLCDAHLNGVDLCAALLFSGGWVDACENDAGLIDFSMSDKLARRFGAQSEETGKEDGGYGTDTDCGPPCLGPRATNLRESSTNARSQELTECDGHVVEGDHTATVLRRGQLGDVERNDHGCAADTKTNDEPANSELRQVESGCLQDGSDNEDDTGKEDGHLATVLVGNETSNDSTDEGTTRCERSNKLLLGGGELVTEGCANGDQDGGDVSSIIT